MLGKTILLSKMITGIAKLSILPVFDMLLIDCIKIAPLVSQVLAYGKGASY